ncbi:unnamed protein product [Closterium sp. NIES-64]|nr:unnamed protein product [Closterium sp. NIES-64]
MFLNRPMSTMTFYPSSDDKTHGVCAVLDRLPHSFACLALAADKSRRADLNKTLDGMPFASRALTTCAKAAFKPKKAGLVMTLKVYHLSWLEHVVSDCVLYWEERKGRLSNSAGGNAHVVDGLKFLVKESVERAIRIRNPEYDAEREAWIWGRHGLRISACGLKHMRPMAAAQSEGIVGDDDLSASLGAE